MYFPTAYDYYFSLTLAAEDDGLCHLVDGIPYTEAVPHGQKPIANVTDAQKVAENVPFPSGGRVTYNKQLIRRRSEDI